jgi:hypothetical protein
MPQVVIQPAFGNQLGRENWKRTIDQEITFNAPPYSEALSEPHTAHLLPGAALLAVRNWRLPGPAAGGTHPSHRLRRRRSDHRRDGSPTRGAACRPAASHTISRAGFHLQRHLTRLPGPGVGLHPPCHPARPGIAVWRGATSLDRVPGRVRQATDSLEGPSRRRSHPGP